MDKDTPLSQIEFIVIALFNTGGYGVGYGDSEEEAVACILDRIKKEGCPCHVTKFIRYPCRILDEKSLIRLEIYANALTGSRISQLFLGMIA